MIRSVLTPLDGSPFSEHALPLAAALARRAGVTLHLARVHQPLPPPYTTLFSSEDPVDEFLQKQERDYLNTTARRLTVGAPLKVATELLQGDVATALQKRAAAADLVVMATHGRGPLGRFWLGSVADELTRVSTAPLLLVRPEQSLPAIGREPAFRHVIVPLDGNPLAEAALRPAADVAGLFGATCTLLQVVKPALLRQYMPEGGTVEAMAGTVLDALAREQDRLEREAAAYLDGVSRRLPVQGITVRTKVVVDEQPAAALLREAQEGGYDLVALATHGRHGLPRMLLGSVADKLVRGTALPVLLCRPPVS
jgi:nucleotide-binding universal stress UspA family protein